MINDTHNLIRRPTDEVDRAAFRKALKTTVLLAAVNVVLVTVAQLSGSGMLIAGAMLVYLASMFVCPEDTVFYLMVFFLPWSTILKLSPESLSFYSISSILIFMKVVLKNPKLNLKVLVPAAGLLVVTLISKLIHAYAIAPSYLMFFIMLVGFPLLFDRIQQRFDFECCAVFFALGIILATIVSSVFGTHPHLLKYVLVFEQENLEITRLCGFYGDPNFYSAQIVSAFGAILLVIAKSAKRKLLHILLAVFLVLCGFTSLSKSFLICIAIVFAVWALGLLFYKPSKILGVVFVSAIAITIVLFSGALDEAIAQYAVRFGTGSNVSDLTTGRSDLWRLYVEMLANNPLELLFGQGYTSVFNGVHKGSHNTLIQLIYQVGLIGLVPVVGWFGVFRSPSRKKRPLVLIGGWAIACFAMWIGLDMLFFDDLFINILLFVAGIRYVSDPLDTSAPRPLDAAASSPA